MALVNMMGEMDPATKSFVQKQVAKTAAETVEKQQEATKTVIEQNGEVGKKPLILQIQPLNLCVILL